MGARLRAAAARPLAQTSSRSLSFAAMHGGREVVRRVDRDALRDAAIFLDHYRGAIGGEVDRRLGRAQPPPDVRAELVRRFRSFTRLAAVHADAQPSLEGLAGFSAQSLERAIAAAVDAALLCGAPHPVAHALRDLELRFRAGIRRIMRPEEPDAPRRARSEPGRRRVRAAIDRIGDAYLALCLETGRVCDLNPAAEALFGGEARELLEREFRELVDPLDRERYQELEARLDAGEEVPPAAITAARLNGDAIRLSISVASHTIAGRRMAVLVARELPEPGIPEPGTVFRC
jgi:PAS domain S-box-containing protein